MNEWLQSRNASVALMTDYGSFGAAVTQRLDQYARQLLDRVWLVQQIERHCQPKCTGR